VLLNCGAKFQLHSDLLPFVRGTVITPNSVATFVSACITSRGSCFLETGLGLSFL
jgi:hypothetical protein